MTQLEYFRLFHPVPEKDYELLAKKLRTVIYKKNDFITVPGQIQKDLLLVTKGTQMSFFEADEKTHVIAFTYPPNLCAIPESFSFQQPSKYFLKCLSDSEFQCISYPQLQEVLDASHEMERLFRRMTEAILAGMINRHIELHSLSIQERFSTFCQRSPHLLQMVPHKYIASYLGIDPTNFSKLFNNVRF